MARNIHVSQKHRDKNWLYEQYIEQGKTQKEVAEAAGCTQHTISRWLRKYNIKTRSAEDYSIHPFVGKHPKGYLEARSQACGHDDRFYIHRLVAVAKYGFNEVCGMDVHHKNGFGLDNRPENIELKSPEEHMSEHRLKELANGVKLEERLKDE